MVDVRCLADEDLVGIAMEADAPPPEALQHLATCESCSTRLVRLLQAANAVSDAAGEHAANAPCLSEMRIAELAQGDVTADAEAAAHLAACARCSGSLAGVIRLLPDDEVHAEAQRLDASSRGAKRHGVARALVAGATLSAALLAGVMLRPGATPGSTSGDPVPHRERASAPMIVPRIVAPIGPRAATDSLRWTSVPFADRYQVLLFDREGTLAWEVQTSDTIVALPDRLHTRPATYLWKVEARTDWNRWVASEWEELSVDAR